MLLHHLMFVLCLTCYTTNKNLIRYVWHNIIWLAGSEKNPWFDMWKKPWLNSDYKYCNLPSITVYYMVHKCNYVIRKYIQVLAGSKKLGNDPSRAVDFFIYLYVLQQFANEYNFLIINKQCHTVKPFIWLRCKVHSFSSCG